MARRITLAASFARTALRGVARHRGFAAINLGGLAVGLAACLLIGLFVTDELAFDRFHTRGDRLYRLGQTTVGWPYGRILEAEFPEVERVTYLRTYPAHSVRLGDRRFHEPMLYADEAFLDLFDFPLVEGDPDAALLLPYSLVLEETFARTLFGSQPALGQTLFLSDTLRATVTGVARVPRRSHIRFSMLVSFPTLRAMNPAWIDEEMASGWLDLNVVNYVLLREGSDPAAFADKIRDLPTRRAGSYLSGWGSTYRLDLEPMRDIYLRSRFGNQLGPSGSILTVWLLSAVGLFLLLIAVVNFVNLTTSRSIDRAREVGVRKVAGSGRPALVGQFLGESIALCSAAVVLAYGIALLALPTFNELAARTYPATELMRPAVALVLAALALLVGALAGAWPAFALSSFRPIEVLSGRLSASSRGTRLRQGLVVFQFFVSGVLTIGTLVVASQLRYMQRQDLGFDAGQVVVLDARRAPFPELAARSGTLRQTLLDIPGVAAVSQTSYVPGRGGWRGQISFPEGMPDGQSVSLEYVPVDAHYVEALSLRLVAGRDFDESMATDASSAVLINESAVRAAGWGSPAEAVGRRFTSPGSGKPDGTVIGVVADYHHHGLRDRIGPMMLGLRPYGGFFAVRMRGADLAGVLARVRDEWPRFFEGYPYETFFLDEDFARQYEAERRLGRIFSTFAALAIVIAALGLFGLAAFTASRRTKEIGVRKALGASTAAIVALLSAGFLRTVLAAFALCVPAAWFAMTKWLEQFPYRTGIGPDLVATGGLALVLVSLATVSWQAFRAASADPVRSLRYE